jgi:vancomycin permeability regulator SanA
MYTCDYIDSTGREIVSDIKDNMNRAKSEKKAILIAIVATFIIILALIFWFLNSTKISIYWSWTYLDNIKRDSGMLFGASNYLANVPKFNTIVASKKQ